MVSNTRGDDNDPRIHEVKVAVPVPDVGEGLFPEVVISGWYVDDGEIIEEDELLFEISTDKSEVDVPSPATGIVQILIPRETTARTGEVAAIIYCRRNH